MITIKHQPIFDYLRYPGKDDCRVAFLDERFQDSSERFQNLEWINDARGSFGKPVYVTKRFYRYMQVSAPSFKKVYKDISGEFNEQCGILIIPDNAIWDDDDKNLPEVPCCIVWQIKDDKLNAALFTTILVDGPMYGYSTCWGQVKESDNYDIRILPSVTFLRGTVNRGKENWESDWENYERDMSHTILTVMTYLCLRKYAKVEIKDIKHGKQVKINNDVYQTQGLCDYEFMDCKWFTEICSDKEFSVRGHFRLQPKKNEQGEWVKELIYINEFKKHGYHRKAGIQKQTESLASQNNNQYETAPINSNQTESTERTV